MIVTIDGHAGSGKSTAARQLADALGYELMNTGAMYRAAAWTLARAGVDLAAEPRDVPAIQALIEPFHFAFSGHRVELCGVDLHGQLDGEALGAAASRVGTFREVRRKLQAEQRRLAEGKDVVCEGRDQGSVVFPDAPAKFFFTASAACRASRRAAQGGHDWPPGSPGHAELVAMILARDRQDEARELDPLLVPAGAVTLDTSELAPGDVLAIMLEVVARCPRPA